MILAILKEGSMGLLFFPSKTTGKIGVARVHLITQLFFVVFCTFGLITTVFAKDQCETIRLTGHPHDPPASWLNSKGELTGASIDLAQQLLTQIGVKRFEVIPFQTVPQAAQATLRGDSDMIVATGMTFERSLQLHYIQPAYYTKLVVVVVRKNESFNLLTYDDLKKRRGSSGAGVSFGQGEFGKLIGLEIGTLKSKSVGESFDRLINGEVDYNLLYQKTAESWITRNNLWDQVELLPVLAGSNNYYMAWSKLSKCRDQKLLSDFSAALKNAHDAGVFSELLAKYEDQYVEELLIERADKGQFQ